MQKTRRTSKTKELISKIILFLSDILTIFISISVSYFLFKLFQDNDAVAHLSFFNSCFKVLPLYIIISFIFFYEGLYSHRFDFWHETRIVFKSLFLSFLILSAYIVITNATDEFPKKMMIYSFFFMILLFPSQKLFMKNLLFNLGFWKKGVKVLSKDTFLSDEILNDPYLGYIKSKRKVAEVVFIDSHNKNQKDLRKLLAHEIQDKESVIFIPVFNNYQFTSSNLFELTNTRTNLLVLQNKLKTRSRLWINAIVNFFLSLLILPLLLPIVGLIAFMIKQDSDGPVFFKQKRLGQNGKEFMVFKFRTMYTQEVQEKLLKDYLDENPQEIENYEIYCKYENDPRVTKIGKRLRSSSLDELAQIFNVIKGEMNLVGPRPYLVTEEEKMGKENAQVVLKAKPGITGLWQVSGRNEITFEERVNLEKWYVQNWSLWRDFIILVKTIQVVLKKTGAR